MHRLITCTVFALTATVSLVSSSGAQSASPAVDSVYQRARRMVSEGEGAAGRAIVDSLLRAAAEGTPAYGDALFWHGALAETAADAERITGVSSWSTRSRDTPPTHCCRSPSSNRRVAIARRRISICSDSCASTRWAPLALVRGSQRRDWRSSSAT